MVGSRGPNDKQQYIYIYMDMYTDTIRRKRKESYIGEVASWGQGGLEIRRKVGSYYASMASLAKRPGEY